jgi:hypothetical protein
MRVIGFTRAQRELSDYLRKSYLVLKGGQDAHAGGPAGSPGPWLEPGGACGVPSPAFSNTVCRPSRAMTIGHTSLHESPDCVSVSRPHYTLGSSQPVNGSCERGQWV